MPTSSKTILYMLRKRPRRHRIVFEGRLIRLTKLNELSDSIEYTSHSKQVYFAALLSAMSVIPTLAIFALPILALARPFIPLAQLTYDCCPPPEAQLLHQGHCGPGGYLRWQMPNGAPASVLH